jgi:hypothetical protein
LVAISLAVFLPACANNFVNYDDNDYVLNNLVVRSGLNRDSALWAFRTFAARNWHPLTWLSLELDYQLYGLAPWGFHLTNVLLHTANVVLLFVVLRRLTGAVWRSAFVAAAFAVHPLHVESVAWTAERKDVLSTLFWMLGLLAYCGYARRRTRTNYLLVVCAFALGLMAKAMLVTFPFVLLLLDYWPLRRLTAPDQTGLRHFKQLVYEKTPLFGLSAASCFVTWYAQRFAIQSWSWTTRAANIVTAYLGYIDKAVWPVNLAVLYPHPGIYFTARHVAVASGVLAFITLLILVLSRRAPYMPVGWFWYLGTLVPVVGVVQAGLQAMADRYTYIPLIGLFIVVAWGSADLAIRWQFEKVVTLLGCAVIALYMSLSWQQVAYWHDTATLWEHTLAVTERSAAGFADRGRWQESIPYYRQAVNIRHSDYGGGTPGHLKALDRLACALLHLRNPAVQEVQFICLHVLSLDPDDAAAHYCLAIALKKQNKNTEALNEFREATRIDPDIAGKLGIENQITGA